MQLTPGEADRDSIIANLAEKDKEAHILGRQGKHADAETILRDNLDRRRNILQLSDDDSLVLDNLVNLGSQLKEQNKFGEAEGLYREALEAETRIYGLEHPATISDLNNLAEVYSHQGRHDEAIDMHRQALDLGAKVWGETDIKYLLMKMNFGNTIAARGDFFEAETMLRQVTEAFRVIEDKSKQPDVKAGAENDEPTGNYMRALNNLASVLGRMGKSDEAIAMFKEVVEQERDDLGRSISLANLSVELKRLGRYEEAEPAMRESLLVMVKCVGKDDWRLKGGLEDLKDILRKLGRNDEAEKLSLDHLMA